MSMGQHGVFGHYNILSLKICSWKILCVRAGKEFIHNHDKGSNTPRHVTQKRETEKEVERRKGG